MPNAYYKLAFQSVGAYWTETYRFDGQVENPDLNLPQGIALANARSALIQLPGTDKRLHPKIVSVTIGNLDRNKQAATFPLSMTGVADVTAVEDQEREMASQVAAKVIFYAAGKTHRMIMRLPGLPVAYASMSPDNPIDSNLTPGARAAMSAWIAALVGGEGRPAGIKGSLLIRYPTYSTAPVRLITAIAYSAAGDWVLTAPSHGLGSEPREIRIRGLRGPSTRGLNGKAWILGGSSDTLFINKRVLDRCGDLLTSYGVVEPLVEKKNYAPVREGWFYGWSQRALTRPSFISKTKNKQACCR